MAKKTIGVTNLSRIYYRFWGLLAVLHVLHTGGCSRSEDGNTHAFDAMPVQLGQLVEEGLTPGAITMVVDKGKVVHKSVVGYQDMATKKPMQENTIFRLYSMSKPFTSVGIMILMEEGKLGLDDPADKFIPSFKKLRVYTGGDLENMETEPVKRPVTIRDLLTHSSGITYHFTGNAPVHQYYRKYGVKRNTPVGSLPTDGPAAESLSELVARIAEAPLLHQPGERFSYSYSTTVLGYIIEQASGKRLDEFLQERIFNPLEMHDTSFFVRGNHLDRFVTNYLMTEAGTKEIENSETTDYKDETRLLDGGGALAGTANDYINFAMMLANEGEWNGVRILQPESVREMFRKQIQIAGLGQETELGFGLGFAIGNAQTETSHFMPEGFYGWAGSGNTFFWVDPANRQAVVFMTQVITPLQFAEKVPFRSIVLNGLNAYNKDK